MAALLQRSPPNRSRARLDRLCAWWLVALSLLATASGCAMSLARHADTLRDPSARADVRAALEELDQLRSAGWLDRIRRGACARTWAAADEVIEDDATVDLRAPIETTSADCRAALDRLEAVSERRALIERRFPEPVMEAFRRALVDLAPVVEECPTDPSDRRSVAAAIARHWQELEGEPRPELRFGLADAGPPCSVATLRGAVTVGERVPEAANVGIMIEVIRGELFPELRGRAFAAEPPTPPTDGTQYDFSDDLPVLSAPTDGPWRDAAALFVTVLTRGGVAGYLLVAASDGWRVIEHVQIADA
jgi:hypothetical protein